MQKKTKTRELSFAQFVYFLRKVSSFFNFQTKQNILVNFIIQKLKKKISSKSILLSKAKFSHFEGMRGDKK